MLHWGKAITGWNGTNEICLLLRSGTQGRSTYHQKAIIFLRVSAVITIKSPNYWKLYKVFHNMAQQWHLQTHVPWFNSVFNSPREWFFFQHCIYIIISHLFLQRIQGRRCLVWSIITSQTAELSDTKGWPVRETSHHKYLWNEQGQHNALRRVSWSLKVM